MNQGDTDQPPDKPSDAEDGEEVVMLAKEDISESLRLCEKNLIGRIFADRLFSVGTIQSAMGTIWSRPIGFRVAYLQDSQQNRVRQEALGEWIRAYQVGKWIFSDVFKNFEEIPKRDWNFTQPERKPPPN
ncbi:hypothetical protein PIB30_064961 [Stylosanthes scabra]|uniref:Uncharacterized protein n=1 Tax=Stylosanthes scabra TaxID=79078 RepID=A0ABU6UKX4_9FABA|nr:hypothetical protein [Stylosanthes scabra]